MTEYVFAADLGGTKCSAAVINQNGEILARATVPVETTSPSRPVEQICDLAQELSAQTKVVYDAAAIAVPGLARRDGTVWAPNLAGWDAIPVSALVQERLLVPVLVESDRNAAVLGESWRGAAQGKTDVIVLMIGTGIGAGILSGGRILRGAHELSGCAGWLTVEGKSSEVTSRIGELESIAAGPAIARAAKQGLRAGRKSALSELGESRISTVDVAAAARRGDELACEIFRNAGRALGLALANMISLLDPEMIVLGGGMASVADLYLDSLRAALFDFAQPLSAPQVGVALSELGDRAIILGCARLALKVSERDR